MGNCLFISRRNFKINSNWTKDKHLSAETANRLQEKKETYGKLHDTDRGNNLLMNRKAQKTNANVDEWGVNKPTEKQTKKGIKFLTAKKKFTMKRKHRH